jgi:hypothetical protein
VFRLARRRQANDKVIRKIAYILWIQFLSVLLDVIAAQKRLYQAGQLAPCGEAKMGLRLKKCSVELVNSVTMASEHKIKSESAHVAKGPRLLSITEVPFLATVLLSLFSWSVTYFTDAIKKSPTICYVKTSTTHKDSPGIRVQYEITNLTRDQVFQNLSFYIVTKKGSLGNPEMIPIAPAKMSDRDPTEAKIQGKSIARYRLPEFHPGWSFQLVADLVGSGGQDDTEVSFDYSNRSELGQTLNVQVLAVRFVGASAETFIAENDFAIITCVFALALIGIISYALYVSKG